MASSARLPSASAFFMRPPDDRRRAPCTMKLQGFYSLQASPATLVAGLSATKVVHSGAAAGFEIPGLVVGSGASRPGRGPSGRARSERLGERSLGIETTR